MATLTRSTNAISDFVRAEELKPPEPVKPPIPVTVTPKMPRAMTVRYMRTHCARTDRGKEQAEGLYDITGILIYLGFMVLHTRKPGNASRQLDDYEIGGFNRYLDLVTGYFNRPTTCLIEPGRLMLEDIGRGEPRHVQYFTPIGAANEVCKIDAQYFATACKHTKAKIWKFSADNHVPTIIGFDATNKPVAIIAVIADPE